MNFQDIDASASPEVQINENFESADFAAVYSKRQEVTTGTTWGYRGGRWGGFAVSAGTLTLTNAATNYLVVLRSNGVISTSTTSTNWDNVLSYARVYKITMAGGVVTAVEDHRAGPNGIFGAITGAAAELRGLTFTSDTDSTADSDPGAGLFKWNNATQSSATVLYFDNQTADGVSLTTLWGSLGEVGFITLQQGDDSTRWQEWKWTALPVDGTGYRKFTVTLQAASASAIQDGKLTLVDFETSVPGAVVGPASATDGAAAVFDGTTGKLIKTSKVTLTIPATGSTITIADGKTFTASGSITLAGTDGKTLTVSNTIILTATDGSTLAIGSGAALSAVGSVTPAADRYVYFTGASTATLGTNSAASRTLIAQATQAAMRSTGLGLDTLTQPLVNYGGLAFNGSTTYLDGNALTGIVDGKKGSIVIVARFANAASASEQLFNATNSNLQVLRTSTGNIQVTAKNAGGATILNKSTTTTPCAAAGTYVIMLSWDMADTNAYRAYVNDVTGAPAAGTNTDDTIDYTSVEYAVGATIAGASFFAGDMYLVWFDPTTTQDFSSASVRRKFSDANNVPQYLGRNGELPTGTTPVLFLGYDSAAQWPINRGSAQSTTFTQNGTIAGVTTVLYGQWAPLENRGTIKTVTADYTVLATDETIINDRAGTNTLTLPDPTTCKNRKLNVQTITANAVNSASSNVIPRAGGAAGTAILGASDGAWAELQSTGTGWQIIKSS